MSNRQESVEQRDNNKLQVSFILRPVEIPKLADLPYAEIVTLEKITIVPKLSPSAEIYFLEPKFVVVGENLSEDYIKGSVLRSNTIPNRSNISETVTIKGDVKREIFR